MEKLYIWFNTSARRSKGFPSAQDMWIHESFTPLKEPCGLGDYKWMYYNYFLMGFPPSREEFKFPQELFLIIQANKEILFDWMVFVDNIMLISETFLEFLKEQKMETHFEIAELKVVHRNNKELKVDKKYFAIRVGKFDDDLFEFVEEGKKRGSGGYDFFIYPNLRLKKEIQQNIFFLDEACYSKTLVFKESIKNLIKEKFASEIYSAQDFYLAYNNSLHEDKLPPLQ